MRSLIVCALLCAVLVQANQWSQDNTAVFGDPHFVDHAGKSFDYQHVGQVFVSKSKIDSYSVIINAVPDPTVVYDAAAKKTLYRSTSFNGVTWPVAVAVHEASGLTICAYVTHIPLNCASKTSGQCGVNNNLYITATMDGMRLDSIDVSKITDKKKPYALKGATGDSVATVTLGEAFDLSEMSWMASLVPRDTSVKIVTNGGTILKLMGYSSGSFWFMDLTEPKDYQSCDKMSGSGASSCPGESSKNWAVTCVDNRFEKAEKSLKPANINAWTPDMDTVMFPTCTPSSVKPTDVSDAVDLNKIQYNHGLTKAQCEQLCAAAKSVPLVYTSCMLDVANSGNADAAQATLAAMCGIKGMDTTGLGCKAAQQQVIGEPSPAPVAGTPAAHVPSCEDVNYCASDDARLERHGACSLLQGQVHCYCYDGWKGTNCTEYKGVEVAALSDNSNTNTVLLSAILVCVIALIIATAGVMLYKRQHHKSTSSHHHHSSHHHTSQQVEGRDSTGSYRASTASV